MPGKSERGGVVGWKVAARSYAAEALGAKESLDRTVVVSREIEHDNVLARTLRAEVHIGDPSLKSGGFKMSGFCWNPV